MIVVLVMLLVVCDFVCSERKVLMFKHFVFNSKVTFIGLQKEIICCKHIHICLLHKVPECKVSTCKKACTQLQIQRWAGNKGMTKHLPSTHLRTLHVSM